MLVAQGSSTGGVTIGIAVRECLFVLLYPFASRELLSDSIRGMHESLPPLDTRITKLDVLNLLS